jgi:hypothetical protein
MLEGHQRVVSRDPIVIRIPDGHDADRGVSGLLDRKVHPSPPDDLTKALAAVHEGRGLRLLDDAALVRRSHETFLEARDVATEARDPVALDAAEVRDDEDVGDDLGVGLGHAQGREDLFAKAPQGVLSDQGVFHDRPPPGSHQ